MLCLWYRPILFLSSFGFQFVQLNITPPASSGTSVTFASCDVTCVKRRGLFLLQEYNHYVRLAILNFTQLCDDWVSHVTMDDSHFKFLATRRRTMGLVEIARWTLDLVEIAQLFRLNIHRHKYSSFETYLHQYCGFFCYIMIQKRVPLFWNKISIGLRMMGSC